MKLPKAPLVPPQVPTQSTGGFPVLPCTAARCTNKGLCAPRVSHYAAVAASGSGRGEGSYSISPAFFQKKQEAESNQAEGVFSRCGEIERLLFPFPPPASGLPRVSDQAAVAASGGIVREKPF
jgi:hypothetical protein